MYIRLISYVNAILILRPSSALLLPPTDPIGSNDNFLNTPIVNTPSNLTTPLSAPITCIERLGRDLSKDSCNNALDKMPRSNNPHVLFPRPRGSSGIPMMWRVPIRYLSDDGSCAIDVKLSHSSRGDTIADRDIAGVAENVLSTCVESQGLGGVGRAPCKSTNSVQYSMSLVRKAHLSTTAMEKEDKRRNF